MPDKPWASYPTYMVRKRASACSGRYDCAVARLNGHQGPQCAFCSECERLLRWLRWDTAANDRFTDGR